MKKISIKICVEPEESNTELMEIGVKIAKQIEYLLQNHKDELFMFLPPSSLRDSLTSDVTTFVEPILKKFGKVEEKK